MTTTPISIVTPVVVTYTLPADPTVRDDAPAACP